MQTKLPYRILALSLALLMLFTSVGFTMDMHFCKGELKSVSLIGKAKSCHEMAQVGCKHHCKLHEKTANTSINKQDCCANKSMTVQLEADFTLHQSIELSTLQLTFITAFISSFWKSNFSIISSSSHFSNYSSPLLYRDICVLIQRFLF